MNIANQGFPATRADLNNALQALVSNSSGTSAPSTTFANQWWYDTTNNKLYIRNEANNAWIQVAVLDQTNNEWQITTGQITAGDSDGLVFKTDDGNTRITLSDGGDVTFADGTDVITASAGSDNVRLGAGAGDSIASGGNNNVTIGKDAGTALTTGDNNTAVGYQALMTEDADGSSTALGYRALKVQNAGSTSNNVAVGVDAGLSVTTGASNTIVGGLAGDALTTGSLNTFVGTAAGSATDDGASNTAVGAYALDAGNCQDHNTAIGAGALGNSSFTGYDNTCVGSDAGNSMTSGYSNTFIGKTAGQLMTGHTNTVLGRFDGNQDGVDARSDNGVIILSDGTGTVRTFISNEGYYRIKSVNATFLGGSSHTITHDNNDTPAVEINNQHGSFNSKVLNLSCDRSATASYHLLQGRSGGTTGDLEFFFTGDGDLAIDGSVSSGGADYAEYFEWTDGNSSNQNRIGYTVVLTGNKITLATSDDVAANIIGAVSVNPSVIGDSDIERWKGKYLVDDFGAYQTEEYTETWWIDENNVKHSYNTDKIPDDVTVPDDATVDTKDANDNTLIRRKLNPDYDADQAYVSREDRKEWATIGMMGKLRIRKGQPTGDRWIKMRDISDTVEEWLVR